MELKAVFWTIDAWNGRWTKTHWLKSDGKTLCGRSTNYLQFGEKPTPVKPETVTNWCKACEKVRRAKR